MDNRINITGSGTASSALDAPFYNEEQASAPMSDSSSSITHPNNSVGGFNAQQMYPETNYWNPFSGSDVPSGYEQSSGVEGDGNGLNNHSSDENNNKDSVLHQEADPEQNGDAQRPLSPESFGSFSMDGEDMMDHGYPFHETPVPNNVHPSGDVAGNGLPVLPNEPSPLSSVPRIDHTSANVNSAVIQQTNEVLINSHNGSIPQPSQVHSIHNTNNESGNGSNHPYEANLQSVESTKHHQSPGYAHPVAINNERQIEERNNSQQHPQQQQPPQGGNDEVIELLDDDDGDNGGTQSAKRSLPMNPSMVTSAGVKRSRPPETVGSGSVVPGSSLTGYQAHRNQYPHDHRYKPPAPGSQTAAIEELARRQRLKLQQRNAAAISNKVSKPHYMEVAPNYTATWYEPLPPLPRFTPQQTHRKQYKHFELSLLNVSEFTITGLPVTFDGRLSSVLGFRKIIKEVSRGHGKPIFERDNPKQNGSKENNSSNDPILNDDEDNPNGGHKNPDGGKWRIPLGAYRSFFTYLQSDKMCRVEPIPEDQLKIASLGKARLDKGYPSSKKVVSYGVPTGLATALAPFQRGGVEFVVEKEGRALIADDMGLGKTIQSIASMSIYHDEWPLLILTPSSARYHWAAEFMNWLGAESSVNNGKGASDNQVNSNTWMDTCDEEDYNGEIQHRNPMRLLRESEIHVMIAGKEKVFPTPETRIVVCSYGLATSLVESGKIYAGLFKCAIVDESHMLKNMKTKRTSKLVPILHATSRCILLSGTPALARPTELWPQLKILSTERDGWWDNENDFVRKYVQRTSAIRRAELHTMLTGTVMIRRLKHNILKSLRSKQREKALVDVLTPTVRREFSNCMKLLREGKGVMAKIAKKHVEANAENDSLDTNTDTTESLRTKVESLKEEYNERYREKLQRIQSAMQNAHHVNEEEREDLYVTFSNQAKNEIDDWYRDRLNEIQNGTDRKKEEEELDRKTILNKMYSMTATAKIPLIAELVGKWLADPTKGKLCIFAHHINVLDEISKRVGLSNEEGSEKRFIRIDGTTNPKERQSQIVAFQNDPNIRIALLGITAAGVAVTLTASSTVWFAELFWTPALMIQAEDRCHRIGQNAAVKCLYFVATGTLDVLLWDLLEKKFQDLGEFVEGKEKMKIVVQHTYKSVKEIQSIFNRPTDDEIDDDLKSGDEETPEDGDDLIKLESDLQEDIGQLAQEEMIMMSEVDDEDGVDNKIAGAPAQKQNPSQTNLPTQTKSGLGETEDEAICLSDDEDDTSNQKEVSASTQQSAIDELPYTEFVKNQMKRVLQNFRFYKQFYDGSNFGIQLNLVDNRLTIASNSFGEKPAVGDVLVAVNGQRLPFGYPLQEACEYMKKLLARGTVELVFLEDDVFIGKNKDGIEKRVVAQRAAALAALQEQKQKSRAAPATSGDVIEILEEDD